MSASPPHTAGMGTPQANDVLEATRALAPDERKCIAQEALRQLSRDDQDDVMARPGRTRHDGLDLAGRGDGVRHGAGRLVHDVGAQRVLERAE